MNRLVSGTALFLGVFALFCRANGSPIAMFINLHGLLLSTGFIAAGLATAGWRLADLGAALRGGGADARQAERSLRFLESVESSAAGSAWLSALVGAVILLANLGASSQVGPALAVVLLAPIYCLVARLCAASLRSGIRRAAVEGGCAVGS